MKMKKKRTRGFFSMVPRRLWLDMPFRDLCDQDKLVFLSLMTSPHSTVCSGLFRCPPAIGSDVLGWDVSGLRFFQESIDRLKAQGLVQFDDSTDMILIPTMILPPDNPNMVTGIQKGLLDIPESSLKDAWIRLYLKGAEGKGKNFEKPLETVSKLLCNRKTNINIKMNMQMGEEREPSSLPSRDQGNSKIPEANEARDEEEKRLKSYYESALVAAGFPSPKWVPRWSDKLSERAAKSGIEATEKMISYFVHNFAKIKEEIPKIDNEIPSPDVLLGGFWGSISSLASPRKKKRKHDVGEYNADTTLPGVGWGDDLD